MKGIEITHSEKAEDKVCLLHNRENGIVYEERSHWKVRSKEKTHQVRPESTQIHSRPVAAYILDAEQGTQS